MDVETLNISIANYCGSQYKQEKNPDNSGISLDYWYYSKPDFDYPKGEEAAWKVGDFRFHESWEWLMPVIQKIIKEGGKVIITEKTVSIKKGDYFEEAKLGNLLQNVYICVAKYSINYNIRK